jgi:VIT1/CCC1 family predicted Fe2+/Mn2+ transporter
MPPDPEQERLSRLRDRQIQARDPHVQQRRIHGKIARKQRSSVEAFSVGRVLSEVPSMWKGAVLGFFVGILGVALIPLVWSSTWALPCSAVLALMLAIFGLIIGRAADTRDSLKDLMR